MKRSDKRDRPPVLAAITLWFLAIICSCFYVAATDAVAADAALDDFDHQGKKFFTAYDATPEIFLSADSGDRNLAGFYDLRQYPGSPPRIPHKVDVAFSGNETDCLSCHAKGGYSAEFGKFVPVTPHPENVLCYQCHAQVATQDLFVATNWRSIDPPRPVFFKQFAAADSAHSATAGELYCLSYRARRGGRDSGGPCRPGQLPAVPCSGGTDGELERIPAAITKG